jgi:rhamnulokinase
MAAIDLGASSGRVIVGTCSPGGFALHEVHRFPNAPVRAGSRLRWDVLGLFRGALDGLRAATLQFGQLDAIGVDGWGVDYGLLDADGELLGNPISYRDVSTEHAVRDVLNTVGAAALYEATGIQLQPFNTLFQLLSRSESVQAQTARHAVLVPDLMTYWLSGTMGTEVTNASTTQLLDPRTLEWATSLAERLGVPVNLFPPLRQPGTQAGVLCAPLAAELGLGSQTEVITVASHDTAAAIAGIPAQSPYFAYVCTGTWALVGLELPKPVITEESRKANFTNEVGVDGSIRFLRNVTGFWLLQECVRSWQDSTVDLGALTRAAQDVPGMRALIDVQQPTFAAAGEMPRRIIVAAERLSGVAPGSRAEIVRCILDSMALAIRHAVRQAASLAGRRVDVVHVVGGGVSNTLFCQLVADACGLPVIAGPAEAASWGNVMSQARALGAVTDSLAENRAIIRRAEQPATYLPRGDERAWDRADRLIRERRQ